MQTNQIRSAIVIIMSVPLFIACSSDEPQDQRNATASDGGPQGGRGAAEGGYFTGQDTAGGLSRGDICEWYCDFMMANCDPDKPGSTYSANKPVYKDYHECEVACTKNAGQFPHNGLDPRTTDTRTGNSIQCRYYYAERAKKDGDKYCPYASPNPTAKCVDSSSTGGDAGTDGG